MSRCLQIWQLTKVSKGQVELAAENQPKWCFQYYKAKIMDWRDTPTNGIAHIS